MEALAELIVFLGILSAYGIVILPVVCVLTALLTPEE